MPTAFVSFLNIMRKKNANRSLAFSSKTSRPKGNNMTPAPKKIVYAAIRQTSDSGKVWIDLESMNFTREGVQVKIDHTAKQIGQWDQNNPVIRIANVEVREIE